MNSYIVLLTKDLWVMKNHIREIKENPKRLGIYLLQVMWIGLILFSLVLDGDKPYGKLQTTIGPQIVGSIYFGVMTALLLYNLYRGTKESSTFFSMGDVHLLFPSPISPKKILLYNMIKQSLLMFVIYGVVLFALFPTLTDIVSVNYHYIGFMYMGYVSFVLLFGPLNFLVFAAGTKYKIQSMLRGMIYALIGAVVLYVIGSMVYYDSALQGLMQGLNVWYINYLPVVGWSRAVFMTAITGYSSFSLVALLLQILLIIGTVFYSYRLADDYYEDVLKATEDKGLRIKNKKNIKQNQIPKLRFRKGKVEVKKVGTGPWAFVWRMMMEYKRTDLHPYFGLVTVLLLVVGITVGYFTKNADTDLPVYIVNGVLAYVLFILSAVKAGGSELAKPYVFLIPGSYMQKIIAINAMDIIRMAINATIMNLALWIMLKPSLLLMIIMTLFVTSFYILNISSNFVVRLIFPNAIDQKALFPLLILLQVIFLLIPGTIVGGLLAAIFQSALVFFAGVALANLIVISVLLVYANVIFEKLEWK
ncbi:MAG: hypothetical protein FH758_05940 [Firmicutes bacterium]|nr:hypothetical protein [Bacillota bacterium]